MRILIVDDHDLILISIKKVLQIVDSKCDVTTAKSCDEGLQLLQQAPFDFVLSDLHLGSTTPNFEILSACSRLGIRCAVLSGSSDSSLIDSAARHGACAYLTKTVSAEALTTLLTLVVKHGVSHAPLVATKVAEHASIETISGKERAVLELLAEGKANKTIAREMGLSPNTVKVYTQRLFKILRVTNRTEAVLEFKRLSKHG